jgi:hypothetical protein
MFALVVIVQFVLVVFRTARSPWVSSLIRILLRNLWELVQLKKRVHIVHCHEDVIFSRSSDQFGLVRNDLQLGEGKSWQRIVRWHCVLRWL